jgi:hypothetical protein
MSDDKRAWKWAPGMLARATVEGTPSLYRLDGADDGLYKESWILVHESRIYGDTDDVVIDGPVTTDAATLGALLGQVREAWRDSYIGVIGGVSGWCVVKFPKHPESRHGFDDVVCIAEGPTEWEALVAALEAVP